MKPEIITLLSALGGVVIGSVINLLILWLTKKYEYRREIKRLIITSGIEQWKETISFARQNKQTTYIAPVMDFILCNSIIMKLVGDKDVDEKKVREAVEKNKRIRKIFEEYGHLSSQD